MNDAELEAIRRNKLRELQRRLAPKPRKAELGGVDQINADRVLDTIFRGRAWEIFNIARSQYPDIMSKLTPILTKLALSGKLKEVTGEQLYLFLRKLGVRVSLDTKIRFTEHGKLKSLSDKIKEDLVKE
jgi:DNA-binding TFAR19-related protein (PDSD5 family)